MPADPTREAELELVETFRSSTSKYDANRRAAPILEQLTREPTFLSAVLEKYVTTPGALDKRNYPIVGMNIALNPYFGLVANCWIPLPDGTTNLSTKAIHHHGDLLLSTATLFGPGYEHWMFTSPRPRTGKPDVYDMQLLEASPHPRHHVAFVDAWVAHTPFYPKSLSITLALWTSRKGVTWRDHLKRLPFFKGREDRLRQLALKLRLKNLDLKVVDSFDFYPARDGGFRVMRQRKEFELGPNADHVASVFHILQQTGNDRLAGSVRRAIANGRVTTGRQAVEQHLAMLQRGTPIAGRLSPGHHDLPFANFTREDIESALRAVDAPPTKGNDDGRKLAPEARGEATARADS